MPGNAQVASSPGAAARTAAGEVWHGLVQALAGREPPPAWRLRSPRERRTAWTTLGLATLALCVINAGTVHGVAALHATLPPGADTIQLAPVLGQRLLAVAVVAPLPLAAWYPTLAWRVGWLALLLSPLAPAHWWGGWPWGPPQILALLAAFALAGIRHQRPALWWMWALSLIPWLIWLIADIPDLKGPASATLIFTSAAVAVDNLGYRLRTQRALATQTQRAETEQARRAVLEERSRIARELHDVVAHHMSLVAVQAETAPYRLTGLPEPVQAEFASLSQVAREALADMRRLLGVLRQDQPADLAPQPQLADLPALVDATRRAGVPVEFSLPPALGQVPAGVGVCAYRIVQESLSNASQHAPGAPVTVSVSHDHGSVLLRVVNGPGSTPSPPSSEPRLGHGLTGMRERVTLLGGSLSAGPRPDGGFAVSAVLPLRDAS